MKEGDRCEDGRRNQLEVLGDAFLEDMHRQRGHPPIGDRGQAENKIREEGKTREERWKHPSRVLFSQSAGQGAELSRSS